MRINISGTTKRLQVVLDAQIGRGGIHNIVTAVQSHDRNIDFVGAAGIAPYERFGNDSRHAILFRERHQDVHCRDYYELARTAVP